MDIKVVALILGTIGTLLGVINFFRSVWDERVRLRIVPSLAYPQGEGMLHDTKAPRIEALTAQLGMPTIAIEVTNFSKFPVTVAEVGLCDGDIEAARSPFQIPRFLRGAADDTWPRRVEARDTLSVYSTQNHGGEYEFTDRTRAYAKTSCGHVAFGCSDALREWTRVQRLIVQPNN